MYGFESAQSDRAGTGASRRNVAHAAAPAGPPGAVVVVLRDGSEVLIRRLCRDDAELERDFLARLSPESIGMRFFGMIRPDDALVRHLTDLDYGRDMAFIALARDGGKLREVGLSRYALAPDGQTCECAITISDDWQGRGLAVVLMRMLIDVARRRGIRSMIAIEMQENQRMQELARLLGFKAEPCPEDRSLLVHRLILSPGGAASGEARAADRATRAHCGA